MIDVREDKKQAEDWLDNGNGEMDADTLNFIAINGFENCGRKPCFSAKACGSDACFCIRATFPSREHYQLYLAQHRLLSKERNSFRRFGSTK